MRRIFPAVLFVFSVVLLIGCANAPDHSLAGLVISGVEITEINAPHGTNTSTVILAELLSHGAKMDKKGVLITGTANYFTNKEGLCRLMTLSVQSSVGLAALVEARQTDGVIMPHLTPNGLARQAARRMTYQFAIQRDKA